MTKPATIEFKAKVQTVYNFDDTVAWRYVKVPALTRAHCDVTAFRSHARYGGLANSDLFPAILSRQVKARGIKDTIRLDQIPADVTIDESGFLARVVIDISEAKNV